MCVADFGPIKWTVLKGNEWTTTSKACNADLTGDDADNYYIDQSAPDISPTSMLSNVGDSHLINLFIQYIPNET
jgi:hypothetical protein